MFLTPIPTPPGFPDRGTLNVYLMKADTPITLYTLDAYSDTVTRTPLVEVHPVEDLGYGCTTLEEFFSRLQSFRSLPWWAVGDFDGPYESFYDEFLVTRARSITDNLWFKHIVEQIPYSSIYYPGYRA